jgi:hypothetical protein
VGRYGSKAFVDISAHCDRPYWYDHVEELLERYAARSVRRLSARKGKRSTSRGGRSNVAGDGSNSEGDRGKNSRAGAV